MPREQELVDILKENSYSMEVLSLPKFAIKRGCIFGIKIILDTTSIPLNLRRVQ